MARGRGSLIDRLDGGGRVDSHYDNYDNYSTGGRSKITNAAKERLASASKERGPGSWPDKQSNAQGPDRYPAAEEAEGGRDLDSMALGEIAVGGQQEESRGGVRQGGRGVRRGSISSRQTPILWHTRAI